MQKRQIAVGAPWVESSSWSAVSHTVQTYLVACGMLGVVLIYLTFAYFGVGLGLDGYSSLLTPRVANPPVRGRTLRHKFSASSDLLLGIVISAAGYAMAGVSLGAALASYLGEESEVAAKTILASGLALYQFKILSGHRKNYLDYRERTDFRVWLRGVPPSGLCVAHRYFFAGWRYRAADEVLLLVAIFGITLCVMQFLFGWAQGKRDWWALGGVVGATLTFAILRPLLLRAWLLLRPEYGLANMCARPAAFYRPRMKEGKAEPFMLHRPGSWRGQVHEDSFRIAHLLEWCARRAQGRYAQHDYDRIMLAARQLAQSFRLKALHVRLEDKGSVADYEERKFLALQLATASDPFEFVGRVGEIAKDDPEPPGLPQRRAVRSIEAVSSAINSHWPAVKTVAVIAAIALLIWSGKLTDAVGLLK